LTITKKKTYIYYLLICENYTKTKVKKETKK